MKGLINLLILSQPKHLSAFLSFKNVLYIKTFNNIFNIYQNVFIIPMFLKNVYQNIGEPTYIAIR